MKLLLKNMHRVTEGMIELILLSCVAGAKDSQTEEEKQRPMPFKNTERCPLDLSVEQLEL